MNIHYINIGSYVLAITFIVLSPTFSLFASNILKLYSVIYAPARLHGMPLLLLNQFVACSSGVEHIYVYIYIYIYMYIYIYINI